MGIGRSKPAAMTSRKLETAKMVLEVLRRLQNTEGAATAATLFNLKDTIEAVSRGGHCAAAIHCARSVTVLAEAMMLNPDEINDKDWIQAIDAAEEWVWVKE